MSRAAARLAKRMAKHKPNRSLAIYVTRFQLDFESFETIERMLLAIRNGALEWGPDGWQIMGLAGEPLHILSALEGWIEYWTEVTQQQGIPYDDGALRRLGKSLEYDKPMTMAEVDAAYEVVQLQRRLYRSLPKSVTTKVCKEVQAKFRRDNEIAALSKTMPEEPARVAW